MLRKLRCIVGIALIMSAHHACAEEDETPSMFRLSGFGSVGAVHSTLGDSADYNSNLVQPDGAGYSRNWDFASTTRLGLQVDANLTDQFSGVAQVLSQKNHDNTFNPKLHLASLKWKMAPSVAIRAGRLAFPAYLVSDYMKVGYAQPWVRPPDEMYYYVTLSSYDGADITFNGSVGETALDFKLLTGHRNTYSSPIEGGPVRSELKMKWGAVLTAYNGASTYKASFLRTRFTFLSPAIKQAFDFLRMLPGPGDGNQLANEYYPYRRPLDYMTLGYSYDPGKWFVMSELSQHRGDVTFAPKMRTSYITAGVRINDFTPYFTLGRLSIRTPTTYPVSTAPGFPPSAEQWMNILLSNGNAAQKRFSAGLRWDFMKNADVKVQFDHVKLDPNSFGTISKPQFGVFEYGRSYNTLSFVFDFVF